mgnify:CR=1 FL=1
MKVKITKQVTEEIEIDFPVYLKYGDNLKVKLINEREAISLSDSSITLTNISMHYYNDTDYVVCEKAEFNTAYDNVIKKLTQLKKL